MLVFIFNNHFQFFRQWTQIAIEFAESNFTLNIADVVFNQKLWPLPSEIVIFQLK